MDNGVCVQYLKMLKKASARYCLCSALMWEIAVTVCVTIIKNAGNPFLLAFVAQPWRVAGNAEMLFCVPRGVWSARRVGRGYLTATFLPLTM